MYVQPLQTVGGADFRSNYKQQQQQHMDNVWTTSAFASAASSSLTSSFAPTASYQQHHPMDYVASMDMRTSTIDAPTANSSTALTVMSPLQELSRVSIHLAQASAPMPWNQQPHQQQQLPPSPTKSHEAREPMQEEDTLIAPLPVAKKRKKNTAHRLRNFLCMHPECGKSFADNAHLRDHTVVHTGEKNLSCSVCGKTFARLSTLHDHQRVHTGEKPYACSAPDCFKRYSSRAALRFHVAVHLNPGARTTSGKSAATSASSSPNAKTVAEEIPNSSTTAKRQLHTCSQCGMQFPSQDACLVHLATHTGTQQATVMTQNDTISSAVSLADQTLEAKVRAQEQQIAQLQAELMALKRRQRAKTPALVISAPVVPANESSSLADVAVEVDGSETPPLLAPAIVAPVRFLQDGVKPFHCCICDRRFTNFYQLSFHAKQHPDVATALVVGTQEPIPVGPKYCPEEDCEYGVKNAKSLKNLQTLKRHWQRRHQTSRPYECSHCGSPSRRKTFKTKENLKAHEKECITNAARQRWTSEHSNAGQAGP